MDASRHPMFVFVERDSAFHLMVYIHDLFPQQGGCGGGSLFVGKYYCFLPLMWSTMRAMAPSPVTLQAVPKESIAI